MLYNYTTESTTYVIWIPLFINPDAAFVSDTVFRCVYISELIFISITISTSWIFIHLFSKIAVFHRNLQKIFHYSFFVYYSAIFGRIIIFVYQVGLVKISGELPQDLPLLTGCLLRSYMFGFIAVSLPGILLERTFASIFIRDYEAKHRSWVSMTICIVELIASSTLVCLVSGRTMYHTSIVITALCVGVMCCISYTFIYHFNRKRLSRLHIAEVFVTENYTLGYRYQLSENVKVLKILQHSVFYLCPVGFITLTPIYVHGLIEHTPWNTSLCWAVLDLLIAMSPHIGLLVISFIVPEVREVLKADLCGIFSKKGTSIQRINIAKARIDTPASIHAYFFQINTAWKR